MGWPRKLSLFSQNSPARPALLLMHRGGVACFANATLDLNYATSYSIEFIPQPVHFPNENQPLLLKYYAGVALSSPILCDGTQGLEKGVEPSPL